MSIWTLDLVVLVKEILYLAELLRLDNATSGERLFLHIRY